MHQSCLLLRRLLDYRKVIFQPPNSWRRGCGLIGPAAIQQAEHRSGGIRFRKLLRLSHPAKGKATQPSKYKYKGYKRTNIQSSSAWGQWRQGYLSHLICFKKSKYQPTTLVHLVGAWTTHLLSTRMLGLKQYTSKFTAQRNPRKTVSTVHVYYLSSWDCHDKSVLVTFFRMHLPWSFHMVRQSDQQNFWILCPRIFWSSNVK